MSRRGMALAAVILALALMSALLGVAFTVGRIERQVARNGAFAAEALAAAESGVATVLAEWEAHPEIGGLAVNQSADLPRVALSDRLLAEPSVRRLTDGLYLVAAEGLRTDAAGGPLARRRVTMVVRTLPGGVAPLGQRSWAGW